MWLDIVQTVMGVALGLGIFAGIVYWTIFDLPYRK